MANGNVLLGFSPPITRGYLAHPKLRSTMIIKQFLTNCNPVTDIYRVAKINLKFESYWRDR